MQSFDYQVLLLLKFIVQNQGNDAFKRGLQLKKKFFLKEAIQKYTEAIGLKDWQDKSLHAALYSNRAQAHLRLENNRNALDDALEALKLEPDNDKVPQIVTPSQNFETSFHRLQAEATFE